MVSVGLTNVFIDDVLKNCNSFRGCYAADKIPNSLLHSLEKVTIVVNLSPHTHKGSHFITIVIFPNFVYYIDSLGLPCFSLHILSFLKQLKRPILYNKKKIQSSTSTYCALYCILFALFFDCTKNDRQKNKLVFTNHFLKNDKKVVKYVKRLIKNQI